MPAATAPASAPRAVCALVAAMGAWYARLQGRVRAVTTPQTGRTTGMDHATYLERARGRGVNPIVYWLVRGVIQPFFHLYFRLSRIGREHVPQEGPVIFAANHRSFLDPFVIGCMMRRPIYYVAKKELFYNRLQGWFLNSLGAFPIDRGTGDADAMATAREILERGDCVLIFPEGTRIRPGGLGRPKRGVGRLALETGAPVVPVAVIGTEAVRRGWRIRPHKVRVRAGRPLTFPVVDKPSPELAKAVTDRFWPMVALQWEWLGGTAPIRRAVGIGAGSWGTGVAVALHRAGGDVAPGCPAAEQAQELAPPRGKRPHPRGGRPPAGAAPRGGGGGAPRRGESPATTCAACGCPRSSTYAARPISPSMTATSSCSPCRRAPSRPPSPPTRSGSPPLPTSWSSR